MPKPSSQEVTNLLLKWCQGKQEALDRLMPIVYEELRRQAHRYMQREKKGHLLQTTALINETYLRLLEGSKVSWKNRAHFFAVTARMMRRILVDYARSNRRQKRGGGVEEISLDQNQIPSIGRNPDLVALDNALKALANEDDRICQVVELRFFGGLSVKEAAEVLNVSSKTVMRDWKLAKTWLAREMNKPDKDNL
jgi:RNA polymerase sigma-70 factor (ECF subfamily)